MENKREGERQAGSTTRKKSVKARVGGVGGSPEREEGMGEETEREERGRDRHQVSPKK
jgi:hypothetical protein